MPKQYSYNQKSQKINSDNQEKKQIHKKVKQIYKPKQLLKRYKQDMNQLIDQTQKQKKCNKQKGTNIPKFIINIFLRNYPLDLPKDHLKRLQQYKNDENKSKTRFDLQQLFGINQQDMKKNLQNQLNRIALLRILNNNYQNILTNQHIINKKTYLLFCKKLIFRLKQPHLIDRLEVG